MVPTPVIVTVPMELTVPALVWPGVKKYVTTPLEAEVALTKKGALP
jgi:hypothetical protein